MLRDKSVFWQINFLVSLKQAAAKAEEHPQVQILSVRHAAEEGTTKL